jgi:hypothetical protein
MPYSARYLHHFSSVASQPALRELLKGNIYTQAFTAS